MGLTMKNFNIFGVHWKIWVLGGVGGGGLTKNQYRGGNCLRRGAWTVYRFKGGGGLARKKGMVFLRGVDNPNAHYGYYSKTYNSVITPTHNLDNNKISNMSLVARVQCSESTEWKLIGDWLVMYEIVTGFICICFLFHL